jgi:hypothetical protein
MKTRRAGSLRAKARNAEAGALPRRSPDPDGAERHALSTATAVAAETLRTGVFPLPVTRRVDEIPHEDATILAGDPDDDAIENEYAGENVPGGSAPTPDQNLVDEIGRAYGLEEEDNGPLHAASEIMERRDRRRSELRAPRRRHG